MKKLTWCLFTILLSLCARSQWTTSGSNIYNSNTGNVGIGTTSPGAPLQINSSVDHVVKILANGSYLGGYYSQNTNSSGHADLMLENDHGSWGSYAAFGLGGSTNTYSAIFGLSRAERVFLTADGPYSLGLMVGTLTTQPLVLGTGDIERMRIDGNGKVGIGITSPTAQLHTTATVRFAGLTSDNTQTKVLVGDANGNLFLRDVSTLGGASSGWALNGNTDGVIKTIGTADNYDFPIITNNVERLRITAGGNVAIGTTNPQGYMLAVNGSAIFTAAWVKPNINWPDYVFQKGYRLPGLDSVSRYIQINKHLPDMPSAETVAKTGIDLGGNQTVLVKKVEELTLYLIGQDKTINDYKQKLADQQRQLDDQQRRLERLEKMMNK